IAYSYAWRSAFAAAALGLAIALPRGSSAVVGHQAAALLAVFARASWLGAALRVLRRLYPAKLEGSPDPPAPPPVPPPAPSPPPPRLRHRRGAGSRAAARPPRLRAPGLDASVPARKVPGRSPR